MARDPDWEESGDDEDLDEDHIIDVPRSPSNACYFGDGDVLEWTSPEQEDLSHPLFVGEQGRLVHFNQQISHFLPIISNTLEIMTMSRSPEVYWQPIRSAIDSSPYRRYELSPTEQIIKWAMVDNIIRRGAYISLQNLPMVMQISSPPSTHGYIEMIEEEEDMRSLSLE